MREINRLYSTLERTATQGGVITVYDDGDDDSDKESKNGRGKDIDINGDGNEDEFGDESSGEKGGIGRPDNLEDMAAHKEENS